MRLIQTVARCNLRNVVSNVGKGLFAVGMLSALFTASVVAITRVLYTAEELDDYYGDYAELKGRLVARLTMRLGVAVVGGLTYGVSRCMREPEVVEVAERQFSLVRASEIKAALLGSSPSSSHLSSLLPSPENDDVDCDISVHGGRYSTNEF